LIIKTLIEKGATMPGPESVEKFGSPLYIAIRRRQLTSADLFLASSVFSDVNTPGGEFHTPLQAAARYLPGIVPRLLALGADARATGGTFGTALHAAAYAKDVASMRLLLEAGIDAAVIAGKYGSAIQAAAKENAVINGRFASGCASVRAMQLLKDHGAQVTAVGGKYHTALQMAVKSGNFEGFRWLLENGADPHVEGGKFGTILKAAARESKVRYNIISYLEQHIFKDTKIDLNFDN
jgi:ankyrin repeat protein